MLGGAWAITEWLRGTMFTGFPWNPAAAALAPTPLIAVTPLIGTYGLSGLVVLLGGAIWLEYYRKWLPLVVILGVTALLWLLPSSSGPAGPADGHERPHRPAQHRPGGQVARRASTRRPRARLAALSGAPTGEPRLLLWPEAAVTDPLEDARTDEHQALRRVRAHAGRLAARPQRPAADRRHRGRLDATASTSTAPPTASSCSRPAGEVVGRYDKAHLVPYGEYLPMRPLLSAIGLSRLAPGDVDFTPGPGPRTIDLGGQWGKVGFQLCYEIIFSGQVVDEQNRPELHLQPVQRRLVRRAGARRSISPRRGCGPPRKACRCCARRRPGSARSSTPAAMS